MLRLFRNKRAQSTAEYAILIGLIVAAAVGMQTYIKRGLQGRARDATDDFVTGVTADANWGTISTRVVSPKEIEEQFEPSELSSRSTQQTLSGFEESVMQSDGTVKRESLRKTQQAEGDFQKYEAP